MNIKIELTTNPKSIPKSDNLVFGSVFSDHMFIMDYSLENGWHDPKIIPYQSLLFDPSIMSLHYGQSIFEGLKAYKTNSEEINLFRPEQNMIRLNESCKRMCIPEIDIDFAVEAVKKLVSIDNKWIPEEPDASLYIRPFIFATDPYLGVRPSDTYRFMIITGPVGAYYKEGLDPVKIYVEEKYVRAAVGGVGAVKTCGNYAASLKAQLEAKTKGFTQVLWLDGIEKKYVEEVGTMNVFFVFENEIVTPSLTGSILPGITRDSSIKLLNHWGYNIKERRISIEEVFTAYEKGLLKEVFGTGTAAVISPVGELCWNNKCVIINNNKTGEISNKIFNTLTSIQYGNSSDIFNWIIKL